MNSSSSRVTLEINLAVIRRNFQKIQQYVQPLKLMGILKANAYGLGVRAIAQALQVEGIDSFGVAEPKEAHEIADLAIPVLILGSILPSEIAELLESEIQLPITSFEVATQINEQAHKCGRKATCHILLDTGMGRLGIPLAEAHSAIRKIVLLEQLDIRGIYSHFPSAYTDPVYSNTQIKDLLSLIDQLKKQDGIQFKEIHISNSDGIHNVPAAIRPPFTHVRTGINLYGCYDLEGRKELQLEEAIQIHSKIVSIRTLPTGSTIGYGRSCRLSNSTLVGTVAIGYADGLPLYFSEQGYLVVKGIRCPILGRTSMDYTTIDLTNIPTAMIGDRVTCLGEGITVSDWARAKKTIPYEVICSIGNRVERSVVDR